MLIDLISSIISVQAESEAEDTRTSSYSSLRKDTRTFDHYSLTGAMSVSATHDARRFTFAHSDPETIGVIAKQSDWTCFEVRRAAANWREHLMYTRTLIASLTALTAFAQASPLIHDKRNNNNTGTVSRTDCRSW